jgi:hypothetical protein
MNVDELLMLGENCCDDEQSACEEKKNNNIATKLMEKSCSALVYEIIEKCPSYSRYKVVVVIEL